MSFYKFRNSYRWGGSLPATLQRRLGMGRQLQKRLVVREKELARSFAEYLTECARKLFALMAAHPELTKRELRLLIQRLLALTDVTETREGARIRGRFLEHDIRNYLARDAEHPKPMPTARALGSFRRHLREVAVEFDRITGVATESGAQIQPKLSQAVLAFLEECKSTCTPGTYQNRLTFLRTLLELVGDKPIDEVTRQDLREYKEALVRLPAFWEHRFPGVPIREILAKAPAYPTLRPNTINNYLSVIGTLFEWALINGYVTFNPARRLKMKIRLPPSEERDRFSATDLRRIFEASLFFSRTSSVAALEQRKSDPSTFHFFWIPLIALYSGMRAAEIIGLETRDIERVENVWCFRVRPNGIRALKSPRAERVIPIHPVLLKCGLVRVVRASRFPPRASLWPNLAKSARIGCSSRFSSFWSTYRREAGVDEPRKTFHSFRHTFINQLVNAEPRQEIVHELAGHAMRGQTYERYRKRTAPSRLLKSIKRINFQVRTDHLFRAPARSLKGPENSQRPTPAQGRGARHGLRL